MTTSARGRMMRDEGYRSEIKEKLEDCQVMAGRMEEKLVPPPRAINYGLRWTIRTLAWGFTNPLCRRDRMESAMYRSLLVPLDGSMFGEHALPLALSIARRAGAMLTVLHVHPAFAASDTESPLVFDEAMDQHLKEQQRAYLNGVVQQLRTV